MSASVPPSFCSSCSSQLSPQASSVPVIHNPNQDLHVIARLPKTPARLRELKVDDIEDTPSGRGQDRFSDPQRPSREYAESTKLPSPNNTPLAGPGMDSFGSMCKPSPNNTPMCDRYVQDRGAKYPDNIPDAPTTPLTMKGSCEVKYGTASPNIDRDNGTNGSKRNHLKEVKRSRWT